MLYRLAVNTGFRANELRGLTPEAFDLDPPPTIPPTVTIEAGYSKRRRQDTQPIRPDLVILLRTYLVGKAQGQAVFRVPDKPGKMLRKDLEAAMIPYRDGAGRVVDFHALRHTFISNVVRSEASVKHCQELARHSDPKLTMNVYTHLDVKDLAAVLEGLPSTTVVGPEREAAKATGTYDAVAEAEITPTAHSTARRGHERPKLAPTRQRRVLDVAHDSGIQSPLVVSTCQQVA